MRIASSLARLMVLEFEGYWSFPVLELVLFAGLLSILNASISPLNRYTELNRGIYGLGILFQILIIGILVPRSFAGSLSRREIAVLLSYPVNRWAVLSSKILTSFLTFFAVLALAILIDIPLMSLSFFEPAPYILMAVVAIQVLFLCTLAMFISLMLKSEIVSIFVFLLLMLGLEFNPMASSGAFSYLTQIRSNNVMFQYLTSIFYNQNSQFTFRDFGTALGFPLLASLLLITFSFIYFQKMMQID
jgi:ABC-type transport system involved in multi-copper enzyme maturation permease subunit